MDTPTAFFEDLARSLDGWVDASVSAMTDPAANLIWTSHPEAFRSLAGALSTVELQSALRTALHEVLSGQIHSILVTLDGGTALAEHTTLTITDDDGQELPPGLHEQFFNHLFATKRLV